MRLSRKAQEWIKAKKVESLAGIAGGSGTCSAGVGGRFDAAASSTYAEGGKELLEVFVPANRANDIIFSSYGNEAFEWLFAALTKELINRHNK